MVNAEVTVIGGEDAVENEFPWMAQIRNRSNSNWRTNHHCGGALISDNLVVTAAHCVYGYNASNFQVVLGEHQRSVTSGDEQVFNVRALRRHPDFRMSDMRYDVAVIELAGNATIIPGIVEIAEIGNGPAANDVSTILGWGITTVGGTQASNILQTSEIDILGWQDCRDLRDIWGWSSTAFCGQSDTGATTCHGDSGSPVMRLGTNEIEGVVSGGPPTCGEGYAFYSSFSSSGYWVQSWVDYYEQPHTAGVTCYSTGSGATMCSYQGFYFRDMTFRWSNSRYGMQIVYPSSGSFPYTTNNGSIVFLHPGSNTCPSGTRISLTTTFHGLSLGSGSFTCN